MLTSSLHGMLSMGYPLWKKERKKKKSCSPYLSNKAGKQNIKYVVVAEAAKTGSYKLKAEKMAASIRTRQDPLLLPTPRAFLLRGSCPSTPLPRPWVNAVRTSNFQIHTMRGWGKTTNMSHEMKACTRKKPNGKKKKCQPTPVERERGSFSEADPTPRAEDRGNTFVLLSGCAAPSSLPSALRGRGNLDSPGDIISARPIDANRKQEREFRMIHGMHQAVLPLTQVTEWCVGHLNFPWRKKKEIVTLKTLISEIYAAWHSGSLYLKQQQQQHAIVYSRPKPLEVNVQQYYLLE